MKKVILVVIINLILLVVAVAFIGRTYFPDNIAETSADGGSKQLRTRFYTKPIDDVFGAAEKTVPTLSTYGSAWKVVDKTDGGKARKIKVEVPVIVFTDDLEVTIKPADNEHEVQVDVRSQSRVGKSDFGENARHVRKFLAALDEALK